MQALEGMLSNDGTVLTYECLDWPTIRALYQTLSGLPGYIGASIYVGPLKLVSRWVPGTWPTSA